MKKTLQALEKGLWVKAGAKDSPAISEALNRCAQTCFELNSTPPCDVDRRTTLLRTILGQAGDNIVVHSPFRCDFGFNISVGDDFVGNFNLSILDEAPVTIGDNVLIGPNSSLITIIHALTPDERNQGVMKARPITIGDNVWIAANETVLPGVEIGEGAVIGAGSVVTHSIPPHTLAAGNPCRVLREITPDDTPQNVLDFTH